MLVLLLSLSVLYCTQIGTAAVFTFRPTSQSLWRQAASMRYLWQEWFKVSLSREFELQCFEICSFHTIGLENLSQGEAARKGGIKGTLLEDQGRHWGGLFQTLLKENYFSFLSFVNASRPERQKSSIWMLFVLEVFSDDASTATCNAEILF